MHPGPVGTVIVTPQISGPQQYSVVLADGVQTVTAVVAQILQNAGTPAGNAPVVVAPASLAKMPVVNGLDLSAYPDGPLNVDRHAARIPRPAGGGRRPPVRSAPASR